MDYLLTFQLPDVMDESFIQTIPMHRAKVNSLIEAGVIKSYSVAINREKLWMVVEATDENDVHQIIESLPLHEYLNDYTIDILMFSLNANSEMPHISLN
jgi:muconolactone delta-isomerase